MLKVLDGPATMTMTLAKATAGARRVNLPPQSYLTLVTTTRSLNRLAAAWTDLETRCHVSPTVFQSFDWIKTWNEVYGQPDSARELHVVAGFAENKLVFVLPLMLQSRFGLKTLTWLTEPIGQYGDALVDRDHIADLWFNEALQYLKQNHGADILHLRHVRNTSNFAPYAKAHWFDGQLNERAAAMDLTQFKTDADYDARYDARQRKHRKRARKALEELGSVSYEHLTDTAAIDEALTEATAQKLIWLRDRGRFNTTMACPAHLEMLKRLGRLKDRPVALTVTTIKVAGKYISWEGCFAYHGVQYCYMTAHESTMTNLSPGRLHFDLAQRHWLAQGQKSYDLMVPYDPYKESWSSSFEPVNDYYFPLSALGKAYGHLYLGVLRPRARKIYMKLPVSALRFLKRLLRQ
jgi:CelD/BcsL family acetyltransferase involved in cellulose biosynthesis